MHNYLMDFESSNLTISIAVKLIQEKRVDIYICSGCTERAQLH